MNGIATLCQSLTKIRHSIHQQGIVNTVATHGVRRKAKEEERGVPMSAIVAETGLVVMVLVLSSYGLGYGLGGGCY